MSWMWTLGTPIIRHFKTFTVKWLSMNVDFVELFCFHFDICKLYCLRRPHEDQRRLKAWNCKANISKLTIMTKKTFEYFDDGLEINKGPNMLNRRVNARKAHTLQFFVIGNFIVRPWGRNFGKIVRNRRHSLPTTSNFCQSTEPQAVLLKQDRTVIKKWLELKKLILQDLSNGENVANSCLLNWEQLQTALLAVNSLDIFCYICSPEQSLYWKVIPITHFNHD